MPTIIYDLLTISTTVSEVPMTTKMLTVLSFICRWTPRVEPARVHADYVDNTYAIFFANIQKFYRISFFLSENHHQIDKTSLKNRHLACKNERYLPVCQSKAISTKSNVVSHFV